MTCMDTSVKSTNTISETGALNDIVKATRRDRIGSALLILLCVLLVASFWLVVRPYIDNLLAEATASNGMYRIKLVFVGLALLGIVPALVMIATGWRIGRYQQYPLPNTWVWRDTKIKRGTPAVRIGQLCIGSGIVACIVCIAMLAYAWNSFSHLQPSHKLRPGTVILQQKFKSAT